MGNWYDDQLRELEERATATGVEAAASGKKEKSDGPTESEVQAAAAKLRAAGSAKPGRSVSMAKKLLGAGLDIDEFCAGTGHAARREYAARQRVRQRQERATPQKRQRSAGLPMPNKDLEEGSESRVFANSVTRPRVEDSKTMHVEHAKALLGDSRSTEFVLRGMERHGPNGDRVARADVEARKREREEERYRERVESYARRENSGTTFHNL